MQVGTGGIACAAGITDQAALVNTLTAADRPVAQVCIEGLISISMVNHHHVAIPAAYRSGINDNSAIRGGNQVTCKGSNINCQVHGPVIIPGEDGGCQL